MPSHSHSFHSLSFLSFWFNDNVICFTAPSMPPANITGYNTSSTSIRLIWNQVPLKDKNGVIRRFTVRYWQSSEPINTTEVKEISASEAWYNESSIASSQLEIFSAEFTNLLIWTNYTFQIRAFTIDYGNFSMPLIIRSDEDSKFA